VIAVDTSVLLCAHRRAAPGHALAAATLGALCTERTQWAIPWPCIHEFLAVATHPRVFDPPSTLAEACDQVDAWVESPNLVLLGESPGHWERLRALLHAGTVTGPRIHDGRIAAICLAHGVRELLTADRDFGRFPALKVRNPLIA
jgi:uncharacterized protein